MPLLWLNRVGRGESRIWQPGDLAAVRHLCSDIRRRYKNRIQSFRAGIFNGSRAIRKLGNILPGFIVEAQVQGPFSPQSVPVIWPTVDVAEAVHAALDWRDKQEMPIYGQITTLFFGFDGYTFAIENDQDIADMNQLAAAAQNIMADGRFPSWNTTEELVPHPSGLRAKRVVLAS